MLRSITLSLLGLLATSTLHAQHVSLGIKAGLNASTYQGPDVENPRFRLGPAAGLLVRLPLGQHLDLQPELLYEQRGARTSYQNSYSGPQISFVHQHQERSRLNYVSLPVLLRFHTEKWFAVLGPQLSRLVAGQHKITNTYTLTDGTPDPSIPMTSRTAIIDGVDRNHQWELGGVVGVGYQLVPRLGIELRYTTGFTQVQHPLDYDSVIMGRRTEQSRNNTLQAQVSYQLGKQ